MTKQSVELQTRFTNFFETNCFGSEESVSGQGSTLAQTEMLRIKLAELLKKLEVKTFLDAPCGDFNWMKLLGYDLESYIGIDIVEQIIIDNSIKYSNETYSFACLDICRSPLPRADLIFCRDVLVHLDFENSLAALRNFKSSGAKYLLTTTFTDREGNVDLKDEMIWRTLNLEKGPFHFSHPIYLLNEECTEGDGNYADKSLGLWLLEDLWIG
ncbi:class I SAM-dependent methyltransferase [Sulfuricurvum sp.]|uniref:class I SAM-dependent methyltransferase n=1 Tax=Sulfuricurvum sp. TaxID=2025608 RepID=UPI00356410DB